MESKTITLNGREQQRAIVLLSLALITKLERGLQLRINPSVWPFKALPQTCHSEERSDEESGGGLF